MLDASVVVTALPVETLVAGTPMTSSSQMVMTMFMSSTVTYWPWTLSHKVTSGWPRWSSTAPQAVPDVV